MISRQFVDFDCWCYGGPYILSGGECGSNLLMGWNCSRRLTDWRTVLYYTILTTLMIYRVLYMTDTDQSEISIRSSLCHCHSLGSEICLRKCVTCIKSDKPPLWAVRLPKLPPLFHTYSFPIQYPYVSHSCNPLSHTQRYMKSGESPIWHLLTQGPFPTSFLLP